jgi:hypothetical protein
MTKLVSEVINGGFISEDLFIQWRRKRDISRFSFGAKEQWDRVVIFYRRASLPVIPIFILLALLFSYISTTLCSWMIGSMAAAIIFFLVSLVVPMFGTAKQFLEEVEALRMALNLREGDKFSEMPGEQVGRTLVDIWFQVLVAEQAFDSKCLSIEIRTDRGLDRRKFIAAFEALYKLAGGFGIGLGDKNTYRQEAERRFGAGLGSA